MKAPTPTPRAHVIAESADGFIYAGLGTGTEHGRLDRYDPTLDQWAQRASPPGLSFIARASAVVAGKIYAFGGEGGGTTSAAVHAYDPTTDTWTPRASMPTARESMPAVPVDDRIYVLGGYFCGFALGCDVNEVYDPATDTWTTAAPMPRRRLAHSAAAVGGKIYVFGGQPDAAVSTVFDVVDVYDPATDSWTTLSSPMPRARHFGAIAVLSERILLFGGRNLTSAFLAPVDEFDPATETWTTREPLAKPRILLGGAVTGCMAYAIAGETSGVSHSSVVEALTVDTTPPGITNASVSPSRLWPPNHKLVPVTVSIETADACDLAPVCQIAGVSSNEPDDGTGDGNTSPDWEIAGPLAVNLRAERAGSGTGRTYTIEVQCFDAGGNTSSSQPLTVTVPHSRR